MQRGFLLKKRVSSLPLVFSGRSNADSLVSTVQAKNECFVAFAGLGDAGLGSDGACDGRNSTRGENDYKNTDDCGEHSPTTRAATDLEKQKVENVERAEETDDSQNNDSDCINEMNRKLERVNNFQGEDYTSLGPDVGSEFDSENKKRATVIKEAATISVVGSGDIEVLKQAPVAPTSTARWWLSRVLFAWAAPVISLGIWYGISTVFGKNRETI